jgi:5-hydroxyisourate hydrolase-like protein (transthyretin family)
MNIVINVIDGVHGRPAEGVGVSIAQLRDNAPVNAVSGRTDEYGQFRYATPRDGPAARETYHMELDVDVYFGALGIVSFHKKIAVFFRIINSGSEYQIRSLITPFMQATDYISYHHLSLLDMAEMYEALSNVELETLHGMLYSATEDIYALADPAFGDQPWLVGYELIHIGYELIHKEIVQLFFETANELMGRLRPFMLSRASVMSLDVAACRSTSVFHCDNYVIALW